MPEYINQRKTRSLLKIWRHQPSLKRERIFPGAYYVHLADYDWSDYIWFFTPPG